MQKQMTHLNLPELQTPRVESPFLDSWLESSGMPDELKRLFRQFADYGYAIIDPELENFEQLSQEVILQLATEYRDDKASGRETVRIQDAWRFNAGVKKIATAPRVLELLHLLYGRRPIPFQTLNFPVGTQQPTHSDSIHFHSSPAHFMCGVWVAFEDVDRDNGPLHYYPKSHKLPILNFYDLGLPPGLESYTQYEKYVAAILPAQGFEKVDLSIKKGQALIWAANLFHGGSPILDRNRTRHSQVTHYYFSDCIYYTPMESDPFLGKLRLRELVNIATGDIEKNLRGDIELPVRLPVPSPTPRPGLLSRLKSRADSLLS